MYLSCWLICQACCHFDGPKEEYEGIFTLPHATLFSWAHSFEWTVHALWCYEKHPQEMLVWARIFLDSVGRKLQVKIRHLKLGCQK